MKKLVLYFLLLLLLSACNSWSNLDAPNSNEDIDDLQVSDDFDWSTSLNLTVNISSSSAGIICITSLDETVVFHKGYYNGLSGTYSIIINLPYYMESLRINGEIVSIDSSVIDHTLTHISSSKSFKETASSLSFDGINDYVEIDEKFVDRYPFTFSAWIKTDGFSNDDEDMVIMSIADPKKSDRYYGIFVGEDEGGRACVRARKGSYRTIYGSTVVTDGEWHQIVGVYQSKYIRKLYVDGKLEASDNKKVDYSKAENFSIGRWGDSSPKSYFNGQIDEVQVWSKALSSSEVSDLYAQSPIGNEDDLEAYFKLNNGSGSSVYNEVSESNEGQINGGAEWSTDGMGDNGTPIGGGSDSDGDGVNNADDAFPNDKTKAFNNAFPATGYGTLAFEDLWPAKGDYDFNDLVIDYQFNTITNASNFISQIQANFVVKAIGASFKNGFAFQLPNNNVEEDDISVSGYNVINDYITLSANGLESSQNLPTIIVFDNAFDIMPRIGGEMGVNTDPSATYTEPDTVKIIMNFTADQYTENQLNLTQFNPFVIVDMTRGKEIHLVDYPPTALADDIYFGILHDDSNPASGRYYKTEANLPWAINIYQSFNYPAEKNEVMDAYLKFAEWAESSGDQYSDWYLDNDGYRNTALIY